MPGDDENAVRDFAGTFDPCRVYCWVNTVKVNTATLGSSIVVLWMTYKFGLIIYVGQVFT